MAIASVLDPRCKLRTLHICFPQIFKCEEVAEKNMNKVQSSLELLYNEFVALSVAELSSNEEMTTTLY